MIGIDHQGPLQWWLKEMKKGYKDHTRHGYYSRPPLCRTVETFRTYSPGGVLCQAYSGVMGTHGFSYAYEGHGRLYPECVPFVWRTRCGRTCGSIFSVPKPVREWWASHYYSELPFSALIPYLEDKNLTIDAFSVLLMTGAPWLGCEDKPLKGSK